MLFLSPRAGIALAVLSGEAAWQCTWASLTATRAVTTMSHGILCLRTAPWQGEFLPAVFFYRSLQGIRCPEGWKCSQDGGTIITEKASLLLSEDVTFHLPLSDSLCTR